MPRDLSLVVELWASSKISQTAEELVWFVHSHPLSFLEELVTVPPLGHALLVDLLVEVKVR